MQTSFARTCCVLTGSVHAHLLCVNWLSACMSALCELAQCMRVCCVRTSSVCPLAVCELALSLQGLPQHQVGPTVSQLHGGQGSGLREDPVCVRLGLLGERPPSCSRASSGPAPWLLLSRKMAKGVGGPALHAHEDLAEAWGSWFPQSPNRELPTRRHRGWQLGRRCHGNSSFGLSAHLVN